MPDLSTDELVRDLRARRIMVDGGNGNVYDVADETCDQAAEHIMDLERKIALVMAHDSNLIDYLEHHASKNAFVKMGLCSPYPDPADRWEGWPDPPMCRPNPDDRKD